MRTNQEIDTLDIYNWFLLLLTIDLTNTSYLIYMGTNVRKASY